MDGQKPGNTTASDTRHGQIDALDRWTQASGRDIAALLNPRPLALVGACDGDEVCFATIAWITPVSHAPAMIAFSLRERSRTMEMLSASGTFSLSILPADSTGIELAETCGNRSGRTEDKGGLVPHVRVRVTHECEAPIARDAFSWLTCTVDDIVATGDHLLVIGVVNEARSRCARDEQGRIACSETLLCIQHDTFATGIPL